MKLRLLVPGGNVEAVDEYVATFKWSLKEFEEIHANVQRLLSDEIMEHERMKWYQPKMSTFRSFLKDVEI